MGASPLRIVFATDIHHAFAALGELLERAEADLYLLGGDLVYRAFHRYDTAWRFMELQQILGGRRTGEEAEEPLIATARRLARDRGDAGLAAQAAEYVALCRRAEAYLLKSYDRLERILGSHRGKTVHLIPGNYDMDLGRTALGARDLHLKSLDVGRWRVAGYGGAKVKTPGLPDHLQVPFIEATGGGSLRSEALDFFRRVKPDVLLVHEPPYGYLDRPPGHDHSGSPGIREYVDEGGARLVLSGHYHENWGAAYSKGTCFFNPSSFGSTVEVSRVRPGGYFFDLILGEEGVSVATLRQMDRRRVYDIADYRVGERGISTVILDEARYVELGGQMPKARHIQPIRDLQRIKSFFLGYETPETQHLITGLRKIYRELERQGMQVAFDLLGSLNFGMAREGSDMDLVVYLREADCVLNDSDVCMVPRTLETVFRELEERSLNVEVCDSLDLDRVRRAIENGDTEDGQLQRFVFYRLMCRPVNLRLIKQVENLLAQREPLRRKLEQGLREHLEILVSSIRHVSSLDKYKARLRERDVAIPPSVEKAIRNCLRG